MNSNRDRVEIRFDCPYEREKEREDCSWTVIKKFDSRALISLGLFYSFAGQDLWAGDSLLFRDSYPEKMGLVAWFQITIWREQDWGREKPFITVHALFFISSNHRSEMLCVPKSNTVFVKRKRMCLIWWLASRFEVCKLGSILSRKRVRNRAHFFGNFLVTFALFNQAYPDKKVASRLSRLN